MANLAYKIGDLVQADIDNGYVGVVQDLDTQIDSDGLTKYAGYTIRVIIPGYELHGSEQFKQFGDTFYDTDAYLKPYQEK